MFKPLAVILVFAAPSTETMLDAVAAKLDRILELQREEGRALHGMDADLARILSILEGER